MQVFNVAAELAGGQERVTYQQPRLARLGAIDQLTAAGSGGQNENASAGGCAGAKVRNNNCP